MTRLFAANQMTVFQHILQDIAVAHAGFFHVDARLLGKFKEADVAHHRYDRGVVGKSALLLHPLGKDGDELISIHQLAVFIHSKASVGIPVKGNAYIIAIFLDILAQRCDVGGTAVFVDVDAVRPVVEDGHLCTELAENFSCGGTGTAVGAVCCDFDARQVPLHAGSDVVDIALHHLFPVADGSQVGVGFEVVFHRMVQHDVFYLFFFLVGQLKAVRTENFDTVKFIRIVRCRQHDCCIHIGICH